jgi:hypothetical protein
VKAFLPLCLCLLLAAGRLNAFPTEKQMTARLRPGMTTEEVVAAFGQPSTGVPRLPGVSHLRYIPPIASLTVEKEGYIGFEVELVDGRVKSWRTLHGNPSYAPMTIPPAMGWLRRLMLLVVVGSTVYGVILGARRTRGDTRALLDAYTNQEIPTRTLPVEFRFITHNTTVRQVIEKAGPYSQARKFPIDPRIATGGFVYSDDSPPRPAIILFEWELPFHGGVVLMPEYPFQSDSQIRAVFYRPPRPNEP